MIIIIIDPWPNLSNSTCVLNLRQKFYNLNCVLMITCIFDKTSIPMFPALSLCFFN